jgi:hypothetical protein
MTESGGAGPSPACNEAEPFSREKFDAHRLAFAERVWATVMMTNSRECRAVESMVAHNQSATAQRMPEAVHAGRQHASIAITASRVNFRTIGVNPKNPKRKRHISTNQVEMSGV